ncbi:MAG: alpha/beta fold hydrolase, partial [Methylococcales bacterium]
MHEISLSTARGTVTALQCGNPDGEKILCLHGWLDNAASFIPLMPILEKYHVVALDMPGHGGSQHRMPGYDYVFVDWIHDVLDVLDSLDWQQTHLLGHSMGGAIATVVAASAPERINKLLLIEALGPISGKAEEAGQRLRQAVAARRYLMNDKVARVIPDLETAVNARLAASNMTRDAARLIVQRNLQEVKDGFVWRSDPRMMLPTHVRTDESFIRSWIRAIEAQTLIIAADPAPVYFTPEQRAARLSDLKHGQLVVIPGGHH